MFVSVLIQHFLKINVSCSVFLPNLICRWQDFQSLVQAPWNSPHRSSSCDFYIGYSAYELRPALRCVTWKPSGGGGGVGIKSQTGGLKGDRESKWTGYFMLWKWSNKGVEPGRGECRREFVVFMSHRMKFMQVSPSTALPSSVALWMQGDV